MAEQGGDDLSVKAVIEFTLKGAAADEAKKKVEELAAAGQKTGESFRQVESTAKGAESGTMAVGRAAGRGAKGIDLMAVASRQLRQLLFTTFGVGAMAGLVVAGVNKLLEFQRQIDSLGKSLQSLGLASRSGLGPVLGQLRDIEVQSKLAAGSTLPVMQELAKAARSLAGGIGATQIAAGLTSAGLSEDLGKAASMVAGLLKGDVNPAVEAFNLELRDSQGNLKENARLAMEFFTKLDAARSGFRTMETGAASGMMGARAHVTAWQQFVPSAEELAMRQRILEAMAEKDREIAQKRLDDISKLEQAGHAQLLAVRLEAEKEDAGARLRIQQQMLDEEHERAVEAFQKTGADTTELDAAYLAARKMLHQDYARSIEERERELAEIQAGLEQQRLENYRKGAEEVVRIVGERSRVEKEAQDKALAGAQHVVDAMIDAQMELLQVQIDGMDESDAHRQAALDRMGELEELRARRTIKNEEHLVVALKVLAQRRLNNERAAEQAAFDFTKQATLAKMALADQYAALAFQIGMAIFGQSKAMAIAETIINTSSGIMRATVDPGGYAGLVLAILIGIMGLAQVNKIRQTNPTYSGKGFDDRTNDMLGEHAGRRWARDWVAVTSSGFASELDNIFGPRRSVAPSLQAAAPAGGIVRNVHFHAPVFGGQAGIRAARRMIAKVDREEKLSRRQR